MQKKASINELQRTANRVRRNIIEMMYRAGSGHVGGSLSVADILVVLYYCIMRVRPDEPQWEERDRLILSKGHSGAALYAVLAQKGFFPTERLMDSFIRVGGMLQEHPDMKLTPGIDMSSGSLGQGISAAVGMAWAARFLRKDCRVFAIVGCGEMQEGQVWEAAMSAAHYRLGNLFAIVDYNRMQVGGDMGMTMEVEPVADKWRAFGWKVFEADGHDVKELLDVLSEVTDDKDTQPRVVIARTVKSKGVPFMEHQFKYHAIPFDKEVYERAMMELAEENGDE